MDGYTFVGWFDNENFEGDALEYLPTNIYHNITLYAKFVKNNNSKRWQNIFVIFFYKLYNRQWE